MNLDWVRGPIANVFSVFAEDGKLDPSGQCRFLDFLLESQAISAYFVRTGMGQMFSYSYDDVVQMARLATDHLEGIAPVLVGTSGIWDRNFDARPDPHTYLEQTLSLTQMAEDFGAAGTVHVLPEAIAPDDGRTHEEVIVSYFESLSNVAEKPLFIYQPPPTLKEYQVTPSMMSTLASMSQVAGIKLSSGDATYLTDIAWATKDEEFVLIAGVETSFYVALHLGARAVIGQGCCVNPTILAALQSRFESGDYAGALETQHSVNVLCAQDVAAVPFLKRYACEKGFEISTHDRVDPTNPYDQHPDALSDSSYASYKRLLEEELARFA